MRFPITNMSRAVMLVSLTSACGELAATSQHEQRAIGSASLDDAGYGSGSGSDAPTPEDAGTGSGSDAGIGDAGTDAPGDGGIDDTPVWQPAQALPDQLTWESAGDVGLWFDANQGVLYGSRPSLQQLNMQFQSRVMAEPSRDPAEIRASVYGTWGLGDLATMLTNAEIPEGQRCVASCYLFAERLKAFPWQNKGSGWRPTVANAGELSITFTGPHGRMFTPAADAEQSAAFGVQLELICEYTKPCTGQTLQCGVDLGQTLSGALDTHAKVGQNANPWGFGNKPEAKAEQTVKAGFFKKGENKPIELNITQQAEARVTCGYDTIFSAIASDCAVVNQEGLNFKCTWRETGLKVAKLIYQCAKNEDREKQEGTKLAGGYTEDRFIIDLPHNPNHTPKLTASLGQTFVSYGRYVRVKDNNDKDLTHFAKATGNVSMTLKAENFTVKGGSAVGAVCKGLAPAGGFLGLTLEAKPTEPPTPLPTEDVPCKNIGTKISGDTCMNQGECLRSPDGHVFKLQEDGRAVVYNVTQAPPKAVYWTPGASWPGLKWKHICVGEEVDSLPNGGVLSVFVGQGLYDRGPGQNLGSKTLDEQPITNFDKTCGPKPYLTLDAGKLVLKRENGRICKTYTTR